MVAPAWGSFQKPVDMIQEEETEFAQEAPGGIEDQEAPPEEKPNWGEFQTPSTYQGEPDPTADEDLFGYTIRNIAANASRVGEQLMGRLGNLEKFGKDLLANAPEFGGVIGWALSELLGPERWEKLVRGKSVQEQMFPTSEQLKEFSQKSTGGYTTPKTPGEKRFQNKIEDIVATISGRNIRIPTVRNFALNNILTPVAANVAKDIVEDHGFGEDKANLVKMIVWTPISLAANVNASQYAANLMNRGRNGFGNNITANVPRYQNNLNAVSHQMLRGDPRSSLAQQQISGIENDIAQGQTSMRNLMTRYDAINAAKRDRGLFELSATDRNAAIRNINQVRDVVRSEIEHLGQVNPQALQDWQNGVMAFSTIHRSNALSNWIQSIAKGPYSKLLSAPAAALFGVGGYVAAKTPIISIPGTVGSAATYKTGQVVYRMYNDANLNNYYFRAISAAQAENVPAFISNYEKLNKIL